MEVPRTNFDDALKFLFPGAIFLVCIYIFDSTILSAAPLEKVGLVVGACLLGGVVLFSVYRTILYDYAILSLLDWINEKRGNLNYRLWIRQRYDVQASESEVLYAAVRTLYPELNTPTIRQRSALIHFMYQASIIFLAFFLFSCFQPSRALTFTYLAAGLIMGTSAILADIRLERQVFMILNRAPNKVDRTATKIGIHRRKNCK
jgi:hypothetical protein